MILEQLFLRYLKISARHFLPSNVAPEKRAGISNPVKNSVLLHSSISHSKYKTIPKFSKITSLRNSFQSTLLEEFKERGQIHH